MAKNRSSGKRSADRKSKPAQRMTGAELDSISGGDVREEAMRQAEAASAEAIKTLEKLLRETAEPPPGSRPQTWAEAELEVQRTLASIIARYK